MGLFSPKYPKSDTPGATAVPVPVKRSRTRGSSSSPASSGMNIDQLRHLTMQQGGRVEKAGAFMLIRVESKGLFGGTDYSHERYVKQSDGTWKAG